MADAPFGARSRGCLYTSRARRLNVAGFGEAVGRSRVVQLVSSPCGRHGQRFTPSCSHLRVAPLQNAAGLRVGRLLSTNGASRADPGRDGTKGEKHRSRREPLGRRFATRPAVPMPISMLVAPLPRKRAPPHGPVSASAPQRRVSWTVAILTYRQNSTLDP